MSDAEYIPHYEEYINVGDRTVAGVEPGGVLLLDSHHGSTAALAEAGHVALKPEDPVDELPVEDPTASMGEAGSEGDS